MREKKHSFNQFSFQLLSASLVSRGDEDNGLMGFKPEDIQKEKRRGNKLTCSRCKRKGATIGCCKSSCKKSFHLPCAITSKCSFEFIGTYRSFCNVHIATLNTSKRHAHDEICDICRCEMNEYDRMSSMQTTCCQSDKWFHKVTVDCPYRICL